MTFESEDKWDGVASIFFNLWPLNEQEKELIRRSVSTRRYSKNDVIYRFGERPLYVMYLLRGRVKTFRNSDVGQPKIIRIFRDGQFFSYRSFFAGDNYTTNCVAMDDVQTVIIPVNVIDRLVDSNKSVMKFFLKELANGLGVADMRVVSMAQKHLRGRLAETMLFIEKSFGTDAEGWINGKTSRSDIANLANMTTSNAIRTLAAFRKEGMVETEGKKIRIISPEKLEYISSKE